MKASENTHLIVRSGVRLTPIIEPVICALDKYFQAINKKALVTSGLRDPLDQLMIIRSYILNKGLKDQFDSVFKYGVDDKVRTESYGEIHTWQLGWSKLLNIGVIVNPPLAAKCLLDYHRNGKNKKGEIINGSPHFKGTAFDIGGSENGITDELPAVVKALQDRVPGLLNYLAERENNAIHIDCVKI